MSVQDLNRVHRRYIKISNGFKSAWTFHQFVQGLRKVFIDEGPEPYQADFQSVYGELKEVAQNLSEVTVEQAAERLDEIEKGLVPLVQALLVADEQISPGLLRQFFQRVKNYDDNILSQLIKFYLYFRDSGGWNWDRLDKADFLTTKICEEYQESRDVFVVRDRTHVRELAQGFWAALGAEGVAEIEVAALVQEIDQMREELSALDSIELLHEARLVQRYRDFKHRLGDTFFQPKVLQSIVGANLVFKNHVQQLYRRDEQRIVAEYQHVFDLERDQPVDVYLREELAQFREEVERFEARLQSGSDVRLEELAALRERVRELLPRLQPETTDSGPTPQPPEIREPEEGAEHAYEPSALETYVADQLRAIVDALDDTSAAMEPKKVVFLPDVFSLGLEPREVVAHRRYFSKTECNRELESFLLQGAALRFRIEQDSEEIKGILDDSAVTRDAPVFGKARLTVRHADQAVRRFEHLLEQAVLEGDAVEARSLQVLRMRLMRAHAGLWLQVYKD